LRFILIAACMLTLFCSLPGKHSERTACEFGPAQNLGPSVNSRGFDGSPTVSADEKTLFLTSGRNGQQDLFVSTRPDRESPWGDPLNLGNLVNDSIGDDFSLRLSKDGKALYFASNRSGGYGAGDLYVATRESTEHAWSCAINLGPVLNTAAFEAFPTPGPDGNTLYFNRSTTFDSQDSDIFVTTRTKAQAPWELPQRLPMPINGPGAEFSPSISADGLSLYFASDRSGNLGSIDI
jgi:OmpA-OmpF porin, OOP family